VSAGVERACDLIDGVASQFGRNAGRPHARENRIDAKIPFLRTQIRS